MQVTLPLEVDRMRDKILQLLRECSGYVSGQELCEKLSVSRTAVWKAVNALKEEGYEIEAVRNKGYILKGSPDVILSDEIKSLLDTEWWGRKILYFDSIDSTNNEIKRQAELGALEGLLAIAEEQTAGRGRRGRQWVSPPKSGIWMSFLLRPELEPEQASMLTLVAAMACAKAIGDELSIDVQIKWPNDIVAGGRKVTGILTEMSTEMTYINYVVVGIGINANMKEFPDELQSTATSLALLKGKDVSRSRIVASIGHYFEQFYNDFLETKDMSKLKQEYEALLVNKGKEVSIIDADSETRYTAEGINDIGELIVKDKNGKAKTVRAGEVSVRGIYGYV